MPARRTLFTDASAESLFAPRKLADSEMDITPMIDCVFQLLIFFMVASNMTGGRKTDLPVARHGVGVETNRAAIIKIAAPDSDHVQPQILLDERRETDLDGVRQYIAEHKQQGTAEVIIKAERRVQHGFVQEVARAVLETEGMQFYIGVQDK